MTSRNRLGVTAILLGALVTATGCIREVGEPIAEGFAEGLATVIAVPFTIILDPNNWRF